MAKSIHVIRVKTGDHIFALTIDYNIGWKRRGGGGGGGHFRFLLQLCRTAIFLRLAGDYNKNVSLTGEDLVPSNYECYRNKDFQACVR